MKTKALIYILCVATSVICEFRCGYGQGFTENHGQWHEQVLFKSSQSASQVFIEKNALLFHAWDGVSWANWLQAAHDRTSFHGPPELQHHAYRMKFLGANPNSFIEKLHPSQHYYNYFIGNDSSKWKSGVREYETIIIRELYPKIDLRIKRHSAGGIKYDILVHPGANVSQIRWSYEGISSIKENKGNLELKTSLGNALEMAPVAFSETENGQSIPCRYSLKKGYITFDFPEGYDKNKELIIDPILIFSTFTGATSDNWGFTATYDSDGNAYAGGIVFGFGYPTTVGGFQRTYGGGDIDVSISKFNTTGTSLIFSSFLGGSRIEMPHSMVVDSQKNLIVMGNTGSSNFPVVTGSYDTQFNGGQAMQVWGGVANYTLGSDIFVAKFDFAGTALLGSTFIGGSANDGLNLGSGLKHNYADEFRGEVIVDPQDNILVTSSTSSNNFPTVNAFQASYGGGVTDACVFKLDANLSSLLFSSYMGGSGDDSGYGIQINTAGDIFFCGGTTSSNLPSTPGVVNPNYGGSVDGYLAKLPPAGNSIAALTYIGNSRYNQAYFVQLDSYEDVYVMGQSIGGYPVVAGPTGTVYSNANAGQFVHKLNPALTSTLMSTCFGNSSFQINIVPSAFLVETCNLIYISGWGTSINGASISSSGLPVTSNAYKPTTDGKDFYLMVLKENAEQLHYATFFGANQTGNQSGEHVDGGTSRFDKDGMVYQSMCGGCGGSSALYTTPGAYSANNRSSNCNLAIFKFDVSDYTANISPQVPPQVCLGQNVNFVNASTGGISYVWYFGDGDSTTTFNASHTYAAPGTYEVTLVAYQPSYCFSTDTATTTIEVIMPPSIATTPVNPICPGESVQLNVSGGNSYQWLPANGFPQGQSSSSTPTVTPTTTTTYQVVSSAQCGNDTASVTVPVINFTLSVSGNDTICNGQSTQISATATAGSSYVWSPPLGLNNPSIASPSASPSVNTTYTMTATSAEGCELSAVLYIQVDEFPVVSAGADQTICLGDATQLSATGGTSYRWTPPFGLNNPSIQNPVASPTQSTQYIVDGFNACGFSSDTIEISVRRVQSTIRPDTIICPGESVQLYATGGIDYVWAPAYSLSDAYSPSPVAFPSQSTQYRVKITDSFGCTAFDTVRIRLHPVQNPSGGPDRYIEFGETTTLVASGGSGVFEWSPPDYLSCTVCEKPTARPLHTMHYQVKLTDQYNCSFYDSVTVYVRGDLFVPNAFTPGDVDGLNDMFVSLGRDIEKVELMVFNRWGELLYSSQNKYDGWDGTYMGQLCPLGIYVWKINYVETSGRTGHLIGHVTLLR